MTPGITVKTWRPFERNTLKGFATIEVPSWHLSIADVAIHQDPGGKRWAQLPAKPQMDRDKQPIVKDGKVQYAKIVWFTDAETRQRFSDAVLAALDAHLRSAAA